MGIIKTKIRVRRLMSFSFFLWMTFSAVDSFSQSDTVYRIAAILPFETEESLENLKVFSESSDALTARQVKLSADAQYALDFLNGLKLALNTNVNSIKIQLTVFDNKNSDSLTRILLQKPAMLTQDVIIGSVSSSSGKLVADFCRKNKIVNIQPFTPSKSLTKNNPFHLKLCPTIESHVDAMFQSIVDSFPGANVIVYTPQSSSSQGVAKQFDSLLISYNKTAPVKFTVTDVNAKDMMIAGKKVTIKELLKTLKTNVLILTSFDEAFVNGALRLLYDQLESKKIIVYGMPNLLDGEVTQLDYLNDFKARISSPYYSDSNNIAAAHFIEEYTTENNIPPSSASYLGFDVMNFLVNSLSDYGKDFLSFISTQRYKGTAYTFDIKKRTTLTTTPFPEVESNKTIDYYENTHVNVFKISDYLLVKIR